jgi:DNA-binding response OmpR family regulator
MLSGTILFAVVDPYVSRTIQEALVAEELCIVEAQSRNDVLQSLPDERLKIALIISDSEQDSGLALCREMQRVSDVPIIGFAAQHCKRDKVNALDAGVYDYIVDPLAMQDFLVRIRAVLRRNFALREHLIFVSNNLTIDFGQRTVCVRAKVMHLTSKEHELPRLLVENQDKPLRHRRLLQAMCDRSAKGILSIFECSSVSFERKLQLTLDLRSSFAQIRGSATISRFHGLSDLQPGNAEGSSHADTGY